MKSKTQYLLTAITGMSLCNDIYYNKQRKNKKVNNSLPKATKEERLLKKGLKKFEINGIEIWAINLKNAQKKYNKINKL